MYHQIEGTIIVREVRRLGNDVVDLAELLETSFRNVEWNYAPARSIDIVLDLDGALVALHPASKSL